MKKLKSKKLSGQSTIEFCFVFFAFIAFLSVSYNAVVSFAVYQYLSYANFMAARAYQGARETSADQIAAAQKVMKIYVPGITYGGGQSVRFAFSRNRTLAVIKRWEEPLPGTPGLPFYLEFEVPFVTLPLGPEFRSFFKVTLSTSVTLGREVTTKECKDFFKIIYGTLGGMNAAGHSPDGMEDNGC